MTECRVSELGNDGEMLFDVDWLIEIIMAATDIPDRNISELIQTVTAIAWEKLKRSHEVHQQ